MFRGVKGRNGLDCSETVAVVNGHKELNGFRGNERNKDRCNEFNGELAKLNGYAKKINGHNGEEKTKEKKRKILREKQFMERNSLLTDLYEVKSIKHIYYVFIVILISLVVNYLAHDIIYLGELRLKNNLIWLNFSDFPQVVLGWSAMFTFNIFVYLCFKLWSRVYINISHRPVLRKVWNGANIFAFLFYCFKSLQFAVGFVSDFNIYIAGSTIILTEQVRLLMKGYAYVRSNVNKTVSYQKTPDGLALPSLSHYIYFLFIPTLVYRDEYPRSKEIRWGKALIHFLEVFGVILFMSFFYENAFISLCERFRSEKFTAWDLIWACIKNTLPAMALLVMSFYLILHAWMNAFAELTRFADRQFYQDWWYSTTFSDYYRKWNIVVHDWLYTYIYKDFYENITGGNALLSKLAVFFISSVFHEFIILYVLRMFYPALFVMFFGIGAFLTSVQCPKNSFFNILFLYGMSLGTSISLCSYIIEYCVRENECAASIQSALQPRTFNSDCYM